MLRKIREYGSLITVLALMPIVHHYRDGFQDWLYDRNEPSIAMGTNNEALTNRSQLVAPARIEHMHGDTYTVHFDSDGDGKLDEQTVGVLQKDNLENKTD